MPKKRKVHSANYKAKVALATIRGDKTSNELTSEFGVTSGQMSMWKKQLVEGAPQLFASGNRRKSDDPELIKAPLYEEIGRLKMERDWLKKKINLFNA